MSMGFCVCGNNASDLLCNAHTLEHKMVLHANCVLQRTQRMLVDMVRI